MARVPVRVTLINGLDEVMAHRGEIVADAVRRTSMRSSTPGTFLGGTLPGQTDPRYDEASGLIVAHLGTWEPM